MIPEIFDRRKKDRQPYEREPVVGGTTLLQVHRVPPRVHLQTNLSLVPRRVVVVGERSVDSLDRTFTYEVGGQFEETDHEVLCLYSKGRS